MNILHLMVHHELSMMIKTMKCQSQYKRRVLKSERWTKQQKSYGYLYPQLLSLMRAQHDERMKYAGTAHVVYDTNQNRKKET